MPSRNITNSVFLPIQRYYVNATGVRFPDRVFTGYVGQSRQCIKTWNNTPGYFLEKRKPNPDLPMQPCRVQIWETSAFKGTFSYSFADNGRFPGYYYPNTADTDVICGPFPTLFVTQADVDAADARARQKVLSRLKDQTVNLAQVYAERRLTANMIANTATRIAFAASRLKKADVSGALGAFGKSSNYRGLSDIKSKTFEKDLERRLKSGDTPFSNAWLEIQYGWKPLLGDVYGAAEAIAKVPYRRNLVRIQAKAEAKASDVFVDNLNTVSGATVRRTHIRKTTTTIKYVIFRSNDNPVLHTAASMGITNPLHLAWELLPYSFVVDWFIPIGNYLENIDADLGLNFVKGCKTTFTRTSCSTTVVDRPSSLRFFNVRMRGNLTYVDFERVRLTSFPSNSLPSFKNPLSFTHVANAIALISQTFKR